MAAGGAGCGGDTVEQCRADVERLTRELAEANREKIRAAECGLVVLEENQSLKQRYAELEAEQEALRLELEQLQEAFSQAYSTQRKVAADSESNEEALLQESASKEAYYMNRLLELQLELKEQRATAASAQAERQQMSGLLQELSESNQVLDLQRGRLREEVQEYKLREARLLQDYTELEEENISLQKLVSTLRQNQVEFEGLKHELKVVEEEAELLRSQLQDAIRLRDISEAHLEEALEALKNERELKKHLRRELLQHLSMCDVAYTGSAHLLFTSAPPSGAATPNTLMSPSTEDNARCNGHLLGGTVQAPVPVQRSSGSVCEGSSTLHTEMNMTEIQRLRQQLITVEQEKVTLMNSLQESETQLRHTEGALTEQHERALRLSQKVTALRRLHREEDLSRASQLHQEDHSGTALPYQEEHSDTTLLHQEDQTRTPTLREEAYFRTTLLHHETHSELEGYEAVRPGSLNTQVFSYQTPGLEILQCKYRVAVNEVVELKAELRCLKDKVSQCGDGSVEDRQKDNGLHKLDRQLSVLEKNCQDGQEKISRLELELQAARSLASEREGALNAAQDELVTLSEELAQLYHHVCLCNNETPNRVMLDFYRSHDS